MKISKLFHWLYAILMLTPVSAVGVTCLTHVFNEEVESETQTAEIEYYLENATTDFVDEQKLNTIYKLEPTTSGYSTLYDVNYLQAVNKTTNNTDYLFYDVNRVNEVYRSIGYTQTQIEIIYDEEYINFSDYDIYISFKNISNAEDSNWNDYKSTNFKGLIESVNIITSGQDTSTNIFYDSCEQVKDSFVLSWCDSNNPVRGVFDFGSSLFNVPSDNLVNYFLTYWCSISIIWLVYDVFMYLFLLIHRLIDKATID